MKSVVLCTFPNTIDSYLMKLDSLIGIRYNVDGKEENVNLKPLCLQKYKEDRQNFPSNYIAITKYLLDQSDNVIITPSRPDNMQLFVKEGIEFLIIVPSKKNKDKYISSLRTVPLIKKEMLDYLDSNWDLVIRDTLYFSDKFPSLCEYYILDDIVIAKETMEDILSISKNHFK